MVLYHVIISLLCTGMKADGHADTADMSEQMALGVWLTWRVGKDALCIGCLVLKSSCRNQTLSALQPRLLLYHVAACRHDCTLAPCAPIAPGRQREDVRPDCPEVCLQCRVQLTQHLPQTFWTHFAKEPFYIRPCMQMAFALLSPDNFQEL